MVYCLDYWLADRFDPYTLSSRRAGIFTFEGVEIYASLPLGRDDFLFDGDEVYCSLPDGS